MEVNNRVTGEELRRSLNLVIVAVNFGIAFAVITGGPAFTGFTRALGAGDLLYGIIMAMPVIGGVLQIFASYYMESTGKRKLLFMLSSFVQRLLWIPIALIPLLMPNNYNLVKIWAVTILITVASASATISSVTFFSWMGDLVPQEISGRYFSKRTRIFTITGAIIGLGAGKFLDSINDFSGYAVLFIIAAVLGAIDIGFFFWVKDPPMKVPEKRPPFLTLIIKPFSNKNYIRFILFMSLWNFGVNLAAPFFNVYMLEYLKMPFFFMFLLGQVVSNLSTIIFIRFWGRMVDRFGNRPIMAICASFIITLPFLWLFVTPQNYWVVIGVNFLGGICWSGFDMGVTNTSIWLAPGENRSIYMANYTLITAVAGAALAFVCGGAFMQFSKPLLEDLSIPFIGGQKFSNFHALFIASGTIRLTAFSLFFSKFKEENSQPPLIVLKSLISSVKGKRGISQ